MGRTRSPSGCKDENPPGVCVSAVDPGGTASVIAEAAAVESRKLRREISCVTDFLTMCIGKEGWLRTGPMSRILLAVGRMRVSVHRNVSHLLTGTLRACAILCKCRLRA